MLFYGSHCVLQLISFNRVLKLARKDVWFMNFLTRKPWGTRPPPRQPILENPKSTEVLREHLQEDLTRG